MHSDLFHIDVNVSTHSKTDKEVTENATKEWNKQFEVNAYVYTGLYFTLFNADVNNLLVCLIKHLMKCLLKI